MGALWNQKLETIAQELANGKTPEDASRLAGFKQGTSFKSNARKRAQRKDVKDRVAQLRAPGIAEAERQTTVNTEYVLTRAARIADFDLPKSAVKVSDQVAALGLIAKVIGALAPEKVEHAGKDGGKIIIEWAPPSE